VLNKFSRNLQLGTPFPVVKLTTTQLTAEVKDGTAVPLVNGNQGTRGTVVVKALCYKPEGRGFDTR
jgi:hypothetical protein